MTLRHLLYEIILPNIQIHIECDCESACVWRGHIHIVEWQRYYTRILRKILHVLHHTTSSKPKGISYPNGSMEFDLANLIGRGGGTAATAGVVLGGLTRGDGGWNMNTLAWIYSLIFPNCTHHHYQPPPLPSISRTWHCVALGNSRKRIFFKVCTLPTR